MIPPDYFEKQLNDLQKQFFNILIDATTYYIHYINTDENNPGIVIVWDSRCKKILIGDMKNDIIYRKYISWDYGLKSFVLAKDADNESPGKVLMSWSQIKNTADDYCKEFRNGDRIESVDAALIRPKVFRWIQDHWTEEIVTLIPK